MSNRLERRAKLNALRVKAVMLGYDRTLINKMRAKDIELMFVTQTVEGFNHDSKQSNAGSSIHFPMDSPQV